MTGDRRIYNILVVEDDDDTIEIITRSLSGRNRRVIMARSMEDALCGFDHAPCDLVVTDIFMAGMGGIEGIQRMRELRPNVKILATSAGFSKMSSDATLKAAERIGANAVIPKPFALNDLREIVDRLLSGDPIGDVP